MCTLRTVLDRQEMGLSHKICPVWPKLCGSMKKNKIVEVSLCAKLSLGDSEGSMSSMRALSSLASIGCSYM